MAMPWNIRGSASQLFYQDKQSPQYQAFIAISDLPHPDRSILGAFVNDAIDPREAALYFLRVTSPQEDTGGSPQYSILCFLSRWKTLIEKFRPAQADSLSAETKNVIYKRDGGCCCVTHIPFKSSTDVKLKYAYVACPPVFTDPDLSEGAVLSDMLSAFISSDTLANLRADFEATQSKGVEPLDNIWLLSSETFDAVKEGEVYFTAQTWESDYDATQTQTYDVDANLFVPDRSPRQASSEESMVLENRIPDQAPILNEQLLDLHARFSKSLAWIEAAKYMGTRSNCAGGSWTSFSIPLTSQLSRFIRRVWAAVPSSVRASVYDGLLWAGIRMYGPSLSMTVYKLPFGLYLRRGSTTLAAKYQVEAHSLRMVEQLTHIPAPRAIDNLDTSRFSYLLMTCVPGRPIGQMLDSMTDEQIKQAVSDLRRYVSELRQIPNKTGEFQICNSKGGGILDWRIPDSQREELRFKTEADFNKYLTDPFWDDVRNRAAISHDIKHDIVFTHGDLNPRNILAENGRITGIVDWENAGWFPDYWEYSKAHYSVRTVIRWLADVVDQVFDGSREELIVENMLSDLLGPF